MRKHDFFSYLFAPQIKSKKRSKMKLEEQQAAIAAINSIYYICNYALKSSPLGDWGGWVNRRTSPLNASKVSKLR
jgi:hypothetical protein